MGLILYEEQEAMDILEENLLMLSLMLLIKDIKLVIV